MSGFVLYYYTCNQQSEFEGEIIMARPTSKADLIAAAGSGYEKLQELIASMTEKELQMPFVFGEEKKEAHWKRDKNLRDVLIHLYEWHQLLLDWVTSNLRGEDKPFIPKPYNWKNYGQLNQFFLGEASEYIAGGGKEAAEGVPRGCADAGGTVYK